LFHNDSFSVFNEDIGRHNCIDKVTGDLLKNKNMDLTRNGIIFLSGRISSEIITKIIRLGVPVLVSRSTPTAAAVHLAREYTGMRVIKRSRCATEPDALVWCYSGKKLFPTLPFKGEDVSQEAPRERQMPFNLSEKFPV
jgi:hypothetical protein